MKEILLKYEKKKCLIWEGSNRVIQNTNQEPLVLEFDQKPYYFYPSTIKKIISNWNKKWINFKTNLNLFDQERIIDKLSKITDKKIFDENIILLELKYKVLQNLYKPLEKKIEIVKNILEDQKFEKKINNEEINFLNKKFLNFKFEFQILVKNIKLLSEIGKTKNIDKNETIYFINKLNTFSIYWSEISENFENLRKKLKENEEFLKIEKKYTDILNNKKPRKKRLNKNNKVIFLNYYKNKSLVWIGTNEKPETVNREILTLSFDNQEFYFYPEGIKTYNYNWNKIWINFKTKLNYTDQEKIINSFDKVYDKTNLYHQIIFFRIKIDFFINEFKILNENLKKEKDTNINPILNNKFIELIMQKEELGNKIDLLYKKILFFNKKNYLYDHFNKKIIKQIINNIKISEQDNKIEIQSFFNETNTKIETLKNKIIILDQKIIELNKNLNFHISIFEKINNYKSDDISIKSENDKPSTSSDLSNNQTIIKQESPGNLTDDILIESEIEFNDHIKSEILKQEIEDNINKPSTSSDLSNNQTIIKQESPEYCESLCKKIKLNEAEDLDYYDYSNFDLEQNELTF